MLRRAPAPEGADNQAVARHLRGEAVARVIVVECRQGRPQFEIELVVEPVYGHPKMTQEFYADVEVGDRRAGDHREVRELQVSQAQFPDAGDARFRRPVSQHRRSRPAPLPRRCVGNPVPRRLQHCRRHSQGPVEPQVYEQGQVLQIVHPHRDPRRTGGVGADKGQPGSAVQPGQSGWRVSDGNDAGLEVDLPDGGLQQAGTEQPVARQAGEFVGRLHPVDDAAHVLESEPGDPDPWDTRQGHLVVPARGAGQRDTTDCLQREFVRQRRRDGHGRAGVDNKGARGRGTAGIGRQADGVLGQLEGGGDQVLAVVGAGAGEQLPGRRGGPAPGQFCAAAAGPRGQQPGAQRDGHRLANPGRRGGECPG